MSERENYEHHEIGHIRTHFDCPYCGINFDLEGDRSVEVIECPDCQKKFWCREVR